MPKNSLKLQLALGASALGMLLLLTQALLQFQVLRTELTSRIESHQFQMLSELGAHLDEQMGDRLRALEAEGRTVPPAMMTQLDQLEQKLRQKTGLLTLFDDLYVFDARGVLLVDWPRKPGRRQLDMASRDYIQGVITRRVPVISQPVLGRATRQPIVVMATPIVDERGELVGIMGGVLNLYRDNLLGSLASRKVGNGGYYYLVSPERVIIAHPDKSRIFTPTSQVGVNTGLDAALQGFEGTVEGVNSRGLQGLFTFKRLRSTGWILASVVPSDEAFRPITTVRERMLVITALLLAIGLALLWGFARRLLQPLDRLSQAMQDTASHMRPGVAAQAVDVLGAQEIRTAAHAFNAFLAARNQAEENLAASEKRMSLIVEKVSDGIWDWDLMGDHLYLNPALRCMLNLPLHTPQEFALNDLERRIHPHDVAAVRLARQSCESGQSEFFDVEHRFLLPGEAVLWVQTSGRVVARDPQGQARRMLGSVINVSSRREQMDKLAQAKALAETASLAKSHFLANMSHEIRTPMNGIMGMTALCLQTELTATQRSYLDMVERSAQSLLAVINDILDLSKIEAHRLELDPQPFSPRELLLQTARTLSLHAAEKRIDLILDTAPDLPATALGDPIRLQQVLTNLLSNAIKFTQRGEVLVRAVRLQPPDAAPEDFWLEVSVHDTGIGIPADKHAAIFDAFTQADVSTARRFGGTGLGLAISRSLVNLMGGDIRVISHDGAGSTFCFTACLRAESPEPTPLPPMPECSGPQQVLVIDDNASQRAVLHRMLRRLGWTPLVCSRIEDALARTQTEPITLALVDLPSTTGDLRALLAPLRQRWPARQLPLALMGTLGQQPTDTVLAQAEAQVFLLKPLDLHALVQGLQPWRWPGQNPLLPTAAAPVVALPPSPPEAIKAWRDDATPLRVLLVEDTPINQKLALILLERMGCAATLACNGIEAVSQFQTQPFDLILMDIQMPEMGGIEATAHIRAHEARTHQTRTPIIALTANALQGARERYLQADMDGYVTKPITVLALQTEIRRLMAQPRATTDHAQN